jgi:hypothetical protein
MRNYNISNSLIKAIDEYALGESGDSCGIQLKAIYIDKTATKEPSSAMKLGQYFEFKATGAKLRDGSEPQPDLLKSGDLSAEYKRALVQANNFQIEMKYHGFEIISVGEIWEFEFEGINVKGILDVLAKDRKGNEVIIDLKYSGLIDDKWNEMGWDKEKLPTRRKLISQPKLYSWLSLKKFGKIYPFYFFIHSSTNTIDRKIYKVDVGKADVLCEDIEKQIKFTDDTIQYHLLSGFEARPYYKRCIECPLIKSCNKAITLPKIEEIFV